MVTRILIAVGVSGVWEVCVLSWSSLYRCLLYVLGWYLPYSLGVSLWTRKGGTSY